MAQARTTLAPSTPRRRIELALESAPRKETRQDYAAARRYARSSASTSPLTGAVRYSIPAAGGFVTFLAYVWPVAA